MFVKPLLSMGSPAGPGGRLSTLIFHRVVPTPDPLFPDEVHAAQFDTLCGWLRHWCHVLPLDEATKRLADGTLPARAATITFDDGYADNHDVALPILRKHGLNATFFIATGFLNGGRMWNDTLVETVRCCRSDALDLRGTQADALGVLPMQTVAQRRQAIAQLLAAAKYKAPVDRDAWVADLAARAGGPLPNDMMMTDDQVRALRHAGMLIGGHTVNHPILASLGTDAVRDEIARGRDTLQAILGQRVGLFAYPNGKPGRDYQPAAVDVVRSLGFDAAVSTVPGAGRQGTDLFQLPRFTPWDRSAAKFGLRLARNLWA